jgi:hypothetical protein
MIDNTFEAGHRRSTVSMLASQPPGETSRELPANKPGIGESCARNRMAQTDADEVQRHPESRA